MMWPTLRHLIYMGMCRTSLNGPLVPFYKAHGTFHMTNGPLGLRRFYPPDTHKNK